MIKKVQTNPIYLKLRYFSEDSKILRIFSNVFFVLIYVFLLMILFNGDIISYDYLLSYKEKTWIFHLLSKWKKMTFLFTLKFCIFMCMCGPNILVAFCVIIKKRDDFWKMKENLILKPFSPSAPLTAQQSIEHGTRWAELHNDSQ